MRCAASSSPTAGQTAAAPAARSPKSTGTSSIRPSSAAPFLTSPLPSPTAATLFGRTAGTPTSLTATDTLTSRGCSARTRHPRLRVKRSASRMLPRRCCSRLSACPAFSIRLLSRVRRFCTHVMDWIVGLFMRGLRMMVRFKGMEDVEYGISDCAHCY